MQKDKKILVSVLEKGEEQWTFKGAGLVEAPFEVCLKNAKDFKRLNKLPETFPEVRFDPESSTLHLKVQFLGRQKNLSLALYEEKLSGVSHLYFRSVGEWLKGLEGVTLVKDRGRQLTEMGVLARYQGKVSWVPDFVVGPAAEAVMHHVAETLRKSLEQDYKRDQGEAAHAN